MAKDSKIVIQSKPKVEYTYSTKLSQRLITVIAIAIIIASYVVIVILSDMWERARVL